MMLWDKLAASPDEIVSILRSATSAAPDPRLNTVLEGVRRQWLEIGRKRYAGLRDDLEDAVQEALGKLVSPAKLEKIRDVTRLETWARSIFVNTVLDFFRDRRRDRRRVYVGPPDEDADVLRDRFPSEAPTPEEMAAHRERLRIVAQCTREFQVARLKFVDDLPEKEIAARQRLTRDGIAGQLKRIRKRLRAALGEPE